MTKKRKIKLSKMLQRLRPVSCLIICGIYALNCLVALTLLSPRRYAVSTGSVAEETIFAPRTVEDTVTTEALRDSARAKVEAVLSLDNAEVSRLISGAESFFEAVKSFRAEALSVRRANLSYNEDENGNRVYEDDDRSWRAVIPESELSAMLRRLPVSVSDIALAYAVLDATDAEVERLEETVMAKLRVKLGDGVTEEARASVRSDISRELQITTLPAWLKSLGEIAYDNYFGATLLIDEQATTRAREKAASAIEPVYVSRGSAIVEKGQTITDARMDMLLGLGLVQGETRNGSLIAGVMGYLLLVYVLFIVYLRAFEKEAFASHKTMLLLLIVMVLTLLVEWLCYLFEPRVVPAALSVLLVSVLVSPSMGMAAGVLTALSMGFLAGGSGTGMLSADAFVTTVTLLFSSFAIVAAVRKSTKRGSLIGAGGVGAAVAALSVLCCAGMLKAGWRELLLAMGCAAASPLVLSVFTVGMLSLWESAFDIVTAARLNELQNANHPLLRKMMVQTPGTYHHSMMTAQLAEGAAQAIGANAMLARVGATYHDVGKLRKPLYFAENQSGKNIHDTLPPRESAEIIMAHLTDAEPLLVRYKLPSQVRQIVREHHGNTLVAYFFYKAQKAAEPGVEVKEKDFRYPASPPSTRESAIVMLADSCEAAVRSMQEPTQEMVADMVKKIIRGKLDDGQFSQCPLTLQELARIERSFVLTFYGLMHERIRYPDDEEEK